MSQHEDLDRIFKPAFRFSHIPRRVPQKITLKVTAPDKYTRKKYPAADTSKKSRYSESGTEIPSVDNSVFVRDVASRSPSFRSSERGRRSDVEPNATLTKLPSESITTHKALEIPLVNDDDNIRDNSLQMSEKGSHTLTDNVTVTRTRLSSNSTHIPDIEEHQPDNDNVDIHDNSLLQTENGVSPNVEEHNITKSLRRSTNKPSGYYKDWTTSKYTQKMLENAKVQSNYSTPDSHNAVSRKTPRSAKSDSEPEVHSDDVQEQSMNTTEKASSRLKQVSLSRKKSQSSSYIRTSDTEFHRNSVDNSVNNRRTEKHTSARMEELNSSSEKPLQTTGKRTSSVKRPATSKKKSRTSTYSRSSDTEAGSVSDINVDENSEKSLQSTKKVGRPRGKPTSAPRKKSDYRRTSSAEIPQTEHSVDSTVNIQPNSVRRSEKGIRSTPSVDGHNRSSSSERSLRRTTNKPSGYYKNWTNAQYTQKMRENAEIQSNYSMKRSSQASSSSESTPLVKGAVVTPKPRSPVRLVGDKKTATKRPRKPSDGRKSSEVSHKGNVADKPMVSHSPLQHNDMMVDNDDLSEQGPVYGGDGPSPKQVQSKSRVSSVTEHSSSARPSSKPRPGRPSSTSDRISPTAEASASTIHKPHVSVGHDVDRRRSNTIREDSANDDHEPDSHSLPISSSPKQRKRSDTSTESHDHSLRGTNKPSGFYTPWTEKHYIEKMQRNAIDQTSKRGSPVSPISPLRNSQPSGPTGASEFTRPFPPTGPSRGGGNKSTKLSTNSGIFAVSSPIDKRRMPNASKPKKTDVPMNVDRQESKTEKTLRLFPCDGQRRTQASITEHDWLLNEAEEIAFDYREELEDEREKKVVMKTFHEIQPIFLDMITEAVNQKKQGKMLNRIVKRVKTKTAQLFATREQIRSIIREQENDHQSGEEGTENTL